MSTGQTQITTEFGKMLRALRRTKHMSQARLASAANLSVSYISLMELGHKNPTVSTVFALSTALKIPPDQLIRRLQNRVGSPGQAGPNYDDSKVGH